MTSLSDTNTVDLVDGVLRIRISTERGGNSLAPDALIDGTRILGEIAAGEHSVGAILLLGPGANFCAGGDVRAFASAEDRPAFVASLADRLHGFIAALVSADIPIVAAVRGWAAGAGMSIVCHADVAIGGPGTSMRPAYSAIGFSPDGGMTWALPRLVGAARARRIILTNAVITAPEALEIGLLAQVVESDDDVISAATDAAVAIAAGPRRSLGAARRLLAASATATLHEQLAAEADSISELAGLPVGIEGVNAFIEKRRPDFIALNGS